jgi:hydroxyethylthiazole kinase-like uncharacterized protein yjeF
VLKILNTEQIRALDAYTIKHTPIASIDLMERACMAFVQWFVQRFDGTKKIGVVCGTGNNGGDGLGIARLLSDWGYWVKVWIVEGQKESGDFKTNLARLPENVKRFVYGSSDQSFDDRDVMIDAVLGSGLTRPTEGLYESAIKETNNCKATRISIDIPSGLFADRHSDGTVVNAHWTVSFQLPKLAFAFPDNSRYVGNWQLVDIGLSKECIRETTTPHFYLTKKGVRRLLKHRGTFAHKGDFGRAMMISGSRGKMGACVLGARGALRAGIGLLTLHVPGVGYSIVQTAVPEAMATVDDGENFFSKAPSLDGFDVVGIGAGLGREKQTVAAFESVLQAGKPMVIDADGLNILGSNRHLLKSIPAGTILTPHPKEFERMTGTWKNDFERLEMQKTLAHETKAVVLLKGAHTSIATPDGRVFFNCTGNPGMATGGSGDVLTGILTGLLAQKYSNEDAAILGVYLHGLSGDLAAVRLGMNSLIASDLVEFLPDAFKELARE